MQLNDNCVDPVCTVGTSPHTTRTRSHDREGEAPGRRLAALNMDICGREKSETPSTHPPHVTLADIKEPSSQGNYTILAQFLNTPACCLFVLDSMESLMTLFIVLHSAQLCPALPSSAQRAEDRFTVLHILWVLSLVTRPHSNGQKTFNGAEINLMLTKNAINC